MNNAPCWVIRVVLTTTGLAFRGRFGGDRFVAGAVGLLVASILLFTVWPVLTILGYDTVDEAVRPLLVESDH